MEIQSSDKTRSIDLIHRTIQDLRDLPTLPAIALEVRRLASNPDTNLSILVDVIEEDVALTARILRIANSAYYGVPRKIDTLKMALVILGMTEISNLVMTISVLKMFPKGEGKGTLDLNEFWKHSAVCAELTVGLYQGLGVRLPTPAYIAGLLHDVGKLILEQYFAASYADCVRTAKEEGLREHEAEVKVLGVDHGHIGSWLCQRWNLPDDITQAVAQHHLRPAEVAPGALPVMIDWADRLSHLAEQDGDAKMSEALAKDAQWQKWSGLSNAKTEELVGKLRSRLERSLTMMSLLA